MRQQKSQYRYIKYENAGDQFVGRALSGLPIILKEFAMSFLYFDFSTCTDEIDKDKRQFAIDAWIRKRPPSGAKNNKSVFYLVKCLVASLVFHEEFLLENLHERSEFRCNIFMTDPVPSAEFVRTAFPWNATAETPTITGIPPHTTLLAEMENLRAIIAGLQATLKNDLRDILKTELDTREVGGSGFVQSNLILSKIDDMMLKQTKQLNRMNIAAANTDNNSPPTEIERDNEFGLIIEEDADDIVAENIEKITTETRNKLRR